MKSNLKAPILIVISSMFKTLNRNFYRVFFKRFSDFLVSLFAILILSPLMILIFFCCVVSTKEMGLFIQKRIGLDQEEFNLYKFKTMKGISLSDKGIASLSKSRVTRFGAFLRKSHLDELPQLFMVLFGKMSLVGPRPEVPEIINIISLDEVKNFTNHKPGLISPASLKYIDEEEILSKSSNAEELYIKHILPDKINMNVNYTSEITFSSDFKIMINYLLMILRIK